MKTVLLLILPCLLTLPLIGCGSGKSSMLIIAHRGASYLAPENTAAAARLAWQLGADAVECDVYLSRDDRIIVLHDASTKRTTGTDLPVSQTPSEELRKLDAGSFKSPEFAGEKIPYLEELIETIPPHGLLFVEIKCGEEILPVLHKVLQAGGKESQVAIIGFHLQTMAAAKKQMPQIPVYWLVGTDKNQQTQQPIPHSADLIQKAREHGLDGLNLHYAGITKEFAEAIRAAGLGFYAWTVNDPVEAIRLKKLGINGITTDRPEWLREQMAAAAD
jgi:glycerophosphoryl diester phosphodiesterase